VRTKWAKLDNGRGPECNAIAELTQALPTTQEISEENHQCRSENYN
jgi:hypothetical protein